MDQFAGLYPDRFHHSGMTMPGVRHAEATRKVKVQLAVFPINDRAFPPFDDHPRKARPRRRNVGYAVIHLYSRPLSCIIYRPKLGNWSHPHPDGPPLTEETSL